MVNNYMNPQPPPPPQNGPASTTGYQAMSHYTDNPQPYPPMAAPPPYNSHSHHPISQVEWSTGLFDCFSDFKNCCMTFWCPCVTFGRIAEIVDQGSTSCGASGALYTLITCVIGCGCLYSCFYRTKMRRQYNLKESPCWDCLVHCCCESCALCQEYRELHNRGFDLVLGWQGNVEQRNRGVTMTMTGGPPTAPPAEHMIR